MNPQVGVFIDGEKHFVPAGISVAAALIAAAKTMAFRHAPKTGEPRGLFCGMGVCFDCLVTVEDRAGVRACMTTVADGMRIVTT